MTRPVAVAITGGIGAGKSEALRGVRAPRRRDRLERRDRPPPAAARRGAGTRSSSAWATASSAPDGEIDRGALATVVFNDRDALDLARGAAAPARRRPEYLQWREQLARPADAAARVRDRGAAPLRDRRRRAVRQGRRDHGAGEAPARCARTSRPSERESRLLPDREKVAARGLRRSRTSGSLEELDAFVGVGDGRPAPREAARRGSSALAAVARRGVPVRQRDEPAVVRAAPLSAALLASSCACTRASTTSIRRCSRR